MNSSFAHPTSLPFAPPPVVVDGGRARKGKPFAPLTADPFRIAPGQRLFAAGEPAAGPFRLIEGAIMVLRTLPGDRRQILDIAGPGRTIGFTAGRRHDCDAVALSPATIVRLDAGAMDQSVAMLAEIARLRDLATLLGRKTAIERLATFLLQMMGDDFEDGQRLEMPISRQDIADHLGVVIETVSRNFVALKRLGALKRAGREDVVILDAALLRRIADGHETHSAVATSESA
ncbi:Crp/Fnr family transcriptional regulator [Rhodoblastus acidophilus]|uniref:Crp/Fnr family transcriptional regulator n=1 Tax=Candidatus Rhodoblastus alkanivorans TaxID=2954117 RepID=A0ABS9Z721_9HYPH|nr:Crp/Fnr family transcriptional regulator [Candidatus Rhodoblastus alkanivorans]MCI4678735.1 Crp/Fnr family transcriptional regulator [Candidatus Rhodoblastus alkanivorans]MCI4683469.1 Crp/Fnr family transcriptional regulator [Candidatus Rhodoblastus alkanivorans]MDI4640783.1 Crp/Fnr family transcriptional regulator [Rhodoblastus acidophilus]